ncbi:MAG: PhzF family phenazine biosynthesis protein [Woeseia sp.]|jgi:trans-2,3-dihydro-3-hydroxyanthranilate isomerase|nr:PhzF family phenazine biosynthesis protein [Woeseia sp.]MBT7256220.1 PhzF family phenazine biosynthesis protein [Planctomycetaceae bacterium]
MRKFKYFICDVFTTTRFGGNQLAVLPDANDLNKTEMQQVAREFNFSESTFVFPGNDAHDRAVRIFTPATEVPFAGHPNIGTAFVLAKTGEFGDINDGKTVHFDEEAGTVSVDIRHDENNLIHCELTAPQGLTLGKTVDAARMAEALSLDEQDIATSTHLPQIAGVGLPFLVVELATRDALQRAQANLTEFKRLLDDGIVPDVHLYVRSNDEFDIRARMFAPFDGVAEDPATGSANCGLVALLMHNDPNNTAEQTWRISQGVEMGRPSVLEARAHRQGDHIQTWIGGNCVLVCEGTIEID